MEVNGGVKAQFHSILILALDGGEVSGQLHDPAALPME